MILHPFSDNLFTVRAEQPSKLFPISSFQDTFNDYKLMAFYTYFLKIIFRKHPFRAAGKSIFQRFHDQYPINFITKTIA